MITRLFNCTSLYFVVVVVVPGVASMESSASGKLGVITLLYIYLTQFLAVLIGLVLAIAIKPGAGFGDQPPDGVIMTDTSYTDVFTDLLRLERT
jgi:Na+/H+-dicarboxylate symporter